MPIPLLGPEQIGLWRMKTYATKRNPTRADVEDIFTLVYYIARRFNLRPDVASSQIIEETGCLTSWESESPRFNFAGLGVTGRIMPGDAAHKPVPEAGNDWQFDPSRGWVEGLNYGDAFSGVMGYLCHLYGWTTGIYPDGVLLHYDPRAVALYDHLKEDKIQPAITTLDLSGPGRWAEAADYWQKIDNIYNTIRTWRPN